METSNRPCGCGDADLQLNRLKIHVWTVRFCPWAPRSSNRKNRKNIASAIARGRLSLRQARAVFGVTRLMVRR